MVFGLTKHGVILPEGGRACQQGFSANAGGAGEPEWRWTLPARAEIGPQRGGARAHPTVSRPEKGGQGLVGQHILVIGHGVHVLAGFVRVGTRQTRRGPGRGVVPSAQVPEDLLHHPRVINDGDDAHGVLAERTAQGVHMPDAEDKVAPAFGGEFGWRGRETPGRRHTSSGGRPRWRTPRILLESQP